MKQIIFVFVMLMVIILPSCKILGQEVSSGLILALVTAIYEIVIRLVPTGTKWLSIIEIVYKLISWLIPNRTTE